MIQAVSASALYSIEATIHSDPAYCFESGVQWRQATLRIAQLIRNGHPAMATCLEMHMCNSIWTPDRLLRLGYTFDDSDIPNTLCSVCGQCTDSVTHRTYYCEATQNILAQGEDGSQHTRPAALRIMNEAKSDIEANTN
jgi:hypothetical protein